MATPFQKSFIFTRPQSLDYAFEPFIGSGERWWYVRPETKKGSKAQSLNVFDTRTTCQVEGLSNYFI